MTYTTINQAVNDQELIDRVVAAASKEAWANPDYAATDYGTRLRTYPDDAIGTFVYAIAIDNEADYEYAVNNGNEHPGSDPGVISDAKIQAGIQAHWPASTEVPPPVPLVAPTPGEPAVVTQPHNGT